MNESGRVNELNTLKIIAETLNGANDLEEMLQSVLEKLLDILDLSTGWMFLVGEKPHYTFIADRHLPPALTWDDKKPMCHGSCWCLNDYWNGKLEEPVNIIQCKRLENAVKYHWGDTKNIRHHATVPLVAGEERFGILNVAAPDKTHFTDEELALLQSVAYQIGTAIKRTTLYHAEQKRAKHYEKLDQLTRCIWETDDTEHLLAVLNDRVAKTFQFPLCAIVVPSGQELQIKSLNKHYRAIGCERIPQDHDHWIQRAFLTNEVQQQMTRSYRSETGLDDYNGVAIPISINDRPLGVLAFGVDKGQSVDDVDIDVMHAVAEHLALAIERSRLRQEREAMMLYEERNRLARDLHDSVNQKLFSMSLLAKGMRQSVQDDQSLLAETLGDIQSYSQEALSEMKALIWQLRPAGVEQGIVTSLKTYAQNLGIQLRQKQVSGIQSLPRKIEEALSWIGREAINNMSKHAKTNVADIELTQDQYKVRMTLTDYGTGFAAETVRQKQTIGLSSMQERVNLVNGQLDIMSTPDDGTVIDVWIPIGTDNSER
ncbi:GAF domain-containing sensor histidine kinase [Tuberibacillus sp. Marseille-P3662]|uniref:GAF domain-containing sensor histidine kinase n=1 Tax=Tuberibacillus sp. Marseille-P3662 TaxID=1965358 RepID=UPI000A1C8EB7|nr:GAF domain-containing sensor histidine kinase [Tuberibacillus sp. Marseille-P3662]